MAIDEKVLSSEVDAFIDKTARDAELAFKVLRETGTLSASRTLNFLERVPGHDLLIALDDPGPWAPDTPLAPAVIGFDGTIHSGTTRMPAGYFTPLFEAYPEITTNVHVHTPYLGAWAQTHRIFPIRYAAVQRLTLSREIHPHLDRRETSTDFTIKRLAIDPHTVAVFEGNGGANVIGRHGLRDTAEFILFLEEGAKFQTLAESLGASQEFGPGTLAQQWGITGLEDEARRLGLITS